MSQNSGLFLASNLSVLNFRIFLIMYPWSLTVSLALTETARLAERFAIIPRPRPISPLPSHRHGATCSAEEGKTADRRRPTEPALLPSSPLIPHPCSFLPAPPPPPLPGSAARLGSRSRARTSCGELTERQAARLADKQV